MVMSRLAPLALALVLVASLGGAAHADGARCTVRSIGAGKAAGDIDAQLADLKAQLTNPPFTAWKSFKLLAQHKFELNPGGSSTFALPEGRQGTITYKEHLGSPGGKHRVRVQLQIKKGADAQALTVFTLDEGGTMLVAGQKLGDGILILGVACNTAS